MDSCMLCKGTERRTEGDKAGECAQIVLCRAKKWLLGPPKCSAPGKVRLQTARKHAAPIKVKQAGLSSARRGKRGACSMGPAAGRGLECWLGAACKGRQRLQLLDHVVIFAEGGM